MDYFYTVYKVLIGYQFFLFLLIQAFFLHPSYEKSLNSRLIRLSLMPLTIWFGLKSLKIRQFEPIEDFFHINFPIHSFSTFHAICLSIEFGLSNVSVLPKDEKEKDKGYGVNGSEELMDENPKEVNQSLEKKKSSLRYPSMGERIKFLIWLIFSPRGIQTTWSPPTQILPRSNQISMKEFIKLILKKSILNHLALIFFWSISVTFAQNPSGVIDVILKERFHLTNSFVLRNLTSSLIVFSFASSAMLLIELLGCMFNLIEVLIYYLGPKFLPSDLAPGEWDSTLYPPLFNQPWKSSSLIEFWSKSLSFLIFSLIIITQFILNRWHTIFRRHIIFCGADPSYWIFKPFGMEIAKLSSTLGAMLFSGLFHEFVVATSSRIDPTFSTTWVFFGSGIGMIFEIAFKKLTGRQVGGLIGKIWLWTVLSFLGRPALQTWFERGLGRSGIPKPSEWSWLRILIPFGPWLPERWIS
ncbi:hypothetical protein DFH28DRAFT_1179113 [Melampsora americana]|nr:hypothetical protein DFH28DRAFT_1179113 [Melampsora americana]